MYKLSSEEKEILTNPIWNGSFEKSCLELRIALYNLKEAISETWLMKNLYKLIDKTIK